jgi:hypothetical protein
MPRPLMVSGVLTLEDPKGRAHRLVAEGSRVVLNLHSLGALGALAQIAPGTEGRAAAMDKLCLGLEAADLTLDVRLWRRTAARLRPGARGGLMGRLFGIRGLRLTPLLFLRRGADDGAD